MLACGSPTVFLLLALCSHPLAGVAGERLRSTAEHSRLEISSLAQATFCSLASGADDFHSSLSFERIVSEAVAPCGGALKMITCAGRLSRFAGTMPFDR